MSALSKAEGKAPRGFAALARAAIVKHVPEARDSAAHWSAKPSLTWVRWPRAGGGYSYLGLRKHLGWVTGEAGVAVEPIGLDQLPLGPPEPAGYRVRLSEILGEADRWWPAGTTPAETTTQLEWIVLQLRVKADVYFARNPPPAGVRG